MQITNKISSLEGGNGEIESIYTLVRLTSRDK